MTNFARRRARLLVALACASACAPAALAEKADREKPINYQADTGDVNYQTKVGTLIGSVIITQGTLTIHADKVILRQIGESKARARVDRQPRELATVELDAPAVRGHQPDDHVEARRLARAVRAQEPDDLAASYVQRHIVDYSSCLVTLFELGNRKPARRPPFLRDCIDDHRGVFGASSPAGFSAAGGAGSAGAFVSDALSDSLGASFALPGTSGVSDFGWKTPRTRAPGPAALAAAGVSARPSALNISVAALYEM